MSGKRRGWFGRAPRVTAQSLYDALRVSARLKVQLVEGRPAVAVQYHNATEVLPVPSVEFVRFVDDLRASQRLKPAKPNDMAALCDFIMTMAKDYPDKGPLLALDRASREVDVYAPSEPTEAEQPPEAADLSCLVITERPAYLVRKIDGLADLEVLRRAYEAQHNVLLAGPPGSGKSLLTRAFAWGLKAPYFRVDFHRDIAIDELFGRYHHRAGRWVWRDGVLVSMIKAGGIFEADEINSMPAEVSTRFHQLLDSRVLSVPEHHGEVIRASPRFMFCATMNDSGDGGRPLTARLRERFDVLPFGYEERVEERICPDPEFRAAFQSLRTDRRIRTPASTRLLATYRANLRIYTPAVAMGFLVANFAEAERPYVRQALTSPLELEAEELASEPTVNFYERRPAPLWVKP
jgi:hypothetical protein